MVNYSTRIYTTVIQITAVVLICVRGETLRNSQSLGSNTRGVTLAFVFDTTGSMYDDLVQVRAGASRILNAALRQKEKPLYNYALIPFHDPEIGPESITTNPSDFQQMLNNLFVQGGGDCPETSIGALKLALELSLPDSFIYLFTDAQAKDHHLTQKVIKLIQEKHSQVNILMTGDCGGNLTIDAGYNAMVQIATVSSGSVFHLQKKDVSEVLKFIENTVSSQKVNIFATDVMGAGTSSYGIPIDSSVTEVTVVISGKNPVVQIRDPTGLLLTTEKGLVEVFNLQTGIVLSVHDPIPGIWNIRITSSSQHTIRVTGVSLLQFKARFYKKDIRATDVAVPQPLAGRPINVRIQIDGLDIQSAVTGVKLVSLRGSSIRTVPFSSDPDTPYVLEIENFRPPSQPFYIQIEGRDRFKYTFHRTSPTAVLPLLPPAPILHLIPQKTVSYGSNLDISCGVNSTVPFTISWSHGNQLVTTAKRYSRSAVVHHRIPSVKMEDSGLYRCTAKNAGGSSFKTLNLFVIGPSPKIHEEPFSTYHAVVGDTISIPCTAYALGRFVVQWSREGRSVIIPGHVSVLPNATMIISSVQSEDMGYYLCTARTDGGTATRRVYIQVQESPLVKVNPRQLSFQPGKPFLIYCFARGHPQPSIAWLKDGSPLAHDGRVKFLPGDVLQVTDTTLSDRGKYTCLARNSAGSARDITTVSAVFASMPKVSVRKKIMLARSGRSVQLECYAVGSPKPVIEWRKDGNLLTPSQRMTFTKSDSLVIVNIKKKDAGKYTCVGTNIAGSDADDLNLEVGVPPRITLKPLDQAVGLGTNIVLRCQASGSPQPIISWQTDQGKDPSLKNNVILERDGSLRVQRLTFLDSGTYRCLAKNNLGQDSAQAVVIITGLSAPKISRTGPDVIRTVQGQTVTIPCATSGRPRPDVQWLRSGTEVQLDGRKMSVLRDNSLRITSTRLDDTAVYECLASNDLGTDRRSVRVFIQVPPEIMLAPESVKVIQGESIVLQCLARGFPDPDIMWFHNNQALNEKNSVLIIQSAQRSHRGEYLCHAVNSVGSDSASATVTIEGSVHELTGKPDITLKPEDSVVEVGDSLMWHCAGNGPPKPTMTWEKEGIPIRDGSTPGVRVFPNNTLWIKNVGPAHAGRYRCIANNGVGSHAVQVDLTVRDIRAIATGRINGDINNFKITDIILQANITSSTNKIRTSFTKVPKKIKSWLETLIVLTTPVYWSSAYETDGAVNGVKLTRGIFHATGAVEFATGEEIKISYIVRGQEPSGAIILEMSISGNTPKYALDSSIVFKKFSEDCVQTGLGQLHCSLSGIFLINGSPVPFAWRNTVTYHPQVGQMPFLVQRLYVQDVTSQYFQDVQKLVFELNPVVTKAPSGDTCPKGLRLHQGNRFCEDIDECVDKSLCDGSCINSHGSYRCSCAQGFFLAQDKTCQDVNECAEEKKHSCDLSKEKCVNEQGGYQCVSRASCQQGFTRHVNGSCVDTDECIRITSGQVTLSADSACAHVCTNIPGSYRCSCRAGYSRSNGKCIDIDECADVNSPCEHGCRNVQGGFVCTCQTGYVLLPTGKCQDVNECLNSASACRPGQQCVNIKGSYQCVQDCKPGYLRSVTGLCEDIDECSQGSARCPSGRDCFNREGSYECMCRRGYRASSAQATCQDVDECTEFPGMCEHECENTQGSYQCLCPEGKILNSDDHTCKGVSDIKEDQENRGGVVTPSCFHNPCFQTCNFLSTGTNCACPRGFRKDVSLNKCISMNQCSLPDGTVCQHQCTNKGTNRKCTCPSGYKLHNDGKRCIDLNECDLGTAYCPQHECFNTRGSFRCVPMECPNNFKQISKGYCVNECTNGGSFCQLEAVRYHKVSLYLGFPANQELLRLINYVPDFLIIPNLHCEMYYSYRGRSYLFGIRQSGFDGIVYTANTLDKPGMYQMDVTAALVYSDGRLAYRTRFTIYIDVGKYPF